MFEETRSRKSRDYRDVIFSEKLRFQDVSGNNTVTKCRLFYKFLRFEGFEKLHFRIGVRPSGNRRINFRDFKIYYGEAVVRRQIVKITSGDVITRDPLRLSGRSLAFYYGKVPSFMFSSLREYKPAVYFSF